MVKRIIPQLKKNLGARNYRMLVKHAQYFMNQEKKEEQEGGVGRGNGKESEEETSNYFKNNEAEGNNGQHGVPTYLQ